MQPRPVRRRCLHGSASGTDWTILAAEFVISGLQQTRAGLRSAALVAEPQETACLLSDRPAAGGARHGAHAAGHALGAMPAKAGPWARLPRPPEGCCATRRRRRGCGCAPGPAACPARAPAAPAIGPRRPRPRARAARRAAAGTARAPPPSAAAPRLRGGRAHTARRVVPRSCGGQLLPRVCEYRRLCTSTTPSAPPCGPTTGFPTWQPRGGSTHSQMPRPVAPAIGSLPVATAR